MAKNDGKQFEELLREIYSALTANNSYTSVEKNVQLLGADGARQIDVLIRSEVAGMALMTVIECRDFNKRLDVTAVDAFQSKIVDVGANKGVLVARKGFSGTAIKKAKRVGITLCTASNAQEILLSLGVQLPVVVTEIAAQLSECHGTLELEREHRFESSAIFTVNDKWLPTIFRDEVLCGSFQCPLQGGTVNWRPQSISPPYFIRDTEGQAHTIDNLSIPVSVVATHFFGHLNDLPEVMALHNLADSSTHVILKAEDIPSIKQRLIKFNDRAQIPNVQAVSVVTVTVPTTFESVTFSVKNRTTGEMLAATSNGPFNHQSDDAKR